MEQEIAIQPKPKNESFQPFAHRSPTEGLVSKILFTLRCQFDLQVASVFSDLKQFVRNASGTIVDFGCGAGPYKHLFSAPKHKYLGLDWNNSPTFSYWSPDVMHYDGKTLPIADNSVDHVISTETFEHLPDPFYKAQEILRILKPGGTFFITVPWSARFHYQPHDYYRFTPTTLEMMFSTATNLEIKTRGTDIATICSKLMVLIARGWYPRRLEELPWSAVTTLLAPLVPALAIIGRVCTALDLGSPDDPLGYTITGTKLA